MYATNYFEKRVLNTMLGTRATGYATLYLALFLSNPGETGTGGSEVAYAGYARQAVAFSAPAAMNGGIGIANVADVTFPVAPVSVGTVTHIGLMDSLTGGNMLLYGAFTESVAIEANEAPVVVAGEAQWWLTGAMSVEYRKRVLGMLRGTAVNAFTPHLALYNGHPEDGGAELAGDNYARVALGFTAPAEQPGGQMLVSNSAEVMSERASGGWGTWRYTAVMDGKTGGVPVFYAERTPKEMRKGAKVVVAEGALALSIH